jgi:uncharacterized protein HemX
MQMSAMPSPTQSFLADVLPIEQSDEETAHIRQADLENGQFTIGWASLGKRAGLTLACFLLAIGIGATATLAWQSRGDADKETTAQAALLKAISLDLEAMRQSIGLNTSSVAASQEQITRTADQLAAHQEQITREMTELRTVEQYVLDKVSTPAPRPALTPMPKAVLRPSQAPIPVTPARNP